MPIIDRRTEPSGKSSLNRKKFIDRFKETLKDHIKKDAVKRNMGDFKDKIDVPIDKKSLEEPTFEIDSDVGRHKRVHSGNKKWHTDDKLPHPKQGGKARGHKGKGEDEFSFVELERDEWRALLFEDMELPDFMKLSLKNDVNLQRERMGFSRRGTPALLSIEKTYKEAFGRRLALEASGSRPEDIAFIEEIDLRYKHYEVNPKPIRHAVMFCVMDVSGSMGEHHKYLAKMFFVLLHLFLEGEYESVDLVFVRHTEDAKEVDQEEFFHSKEIGGTIVASALELVNDIITERYDLSTTNIYVAQASDGDCFGRDGPNCVDILRTKLLPKIQYFAYIEIVLMRYIADFETLMDSYTVLSRENPKLNVGVVRDEDEVFPVLRNLFKKRSAK